VNATPLLSWRVEAAPVGDAGLAEPEVDDGEPEELGEGELWSSLWVILPPVPATEFGSTLACAEAEALVNASIVLGPDCLRIVSHGFELMTSR
jgi:hypothetical protein